MAEQTPAPSNGPSADAQLFVSILKSIGELSKSVQRAVAEVAKSSPGGGAATGIVFSEKGDVESYQFPGGEFFNYNKKTGTWTQTR